LFGKRQLFSYNLDCKAVATRQIPDMYKPKPNPYLNANPNANPNPTNPTSILSKFSLKELYLAYSLMLRSFQVVNLCSRVHDR